MKLLRSLFLMLVVAALAWAAVVWHWQRTQSAIELRDIVLYLLVLPLLAAGGVLALRWAWRHASLAQAARAAAPASAQAPAAAPGAAERQSAMRVLAHGVVLPLAADATGALELTTSPPRLQLDAQLRDHDGLGVFTRRHAGLPQEAGDRALALVQLSIEPVLQQLQACADARTEPAEPPPAHPTLVTARRAALPKPVLLVLWGVPQSEPTEPFDARATAALQEWARQQPAFDWQLQIVRARNGEALLLQAERHLVLAQREGRDEPLLLVAGESWIDEARVERLGAQGRLFSAQHHGGLMPGEAAVALLLAAPGESHPGNVVQLHRLSAQRRDKSADGSGRITGASLAEAARQALEAAQQPAEQIACVVSDTDLRPSRTGELFDALQDAAPPLARAELCRCSGAVTGAVGIVSAPLALALAAAQVQQQREPVLLLTHADPFDRLAAVLSAPASQVPAVP